MLTGALAALIGDWLSAGLAATIIIGIAGSLIALTVLILTVIRHVNRTWERSPEPFVGTGLG